MSNLKCKGVNRIFDRIEEINETYGVDLGLPKNIPPETNIVCYRIVDLYKIELFMYFKQTLCDLLGYVGGKWVASGSVSLEEEIKGDSESGNNCYIYLNLIQKEVKDKFTPDCLIGIETTKGFITNVVEIGLYAVMKPSYYVYTTESLSKRDLYDVHNIKYYISDDSDETVSFGEYVKLFYDVEGVL